ncbi:MAG: sulfite exporter TauE/SafE family protein, partial [Thiobacillus sp.]|nr:sulfite exporter TauE/SafE family protein [Thiobacillus sp.]
MSLEQLAVSSIAGAAAILLAAYVIRGITGFGSGLISVPFLALFLPLKFVVPLILLLDFTASIVIGGLNFKRVKWDEIGVLIPFGVVGVVLGTSLLVNLPPEPMLMALAGFVFIFALRSLFNIHGEKPVSRGWAVPAAL